MPSTTTHWPPAASTGPVSVIGPQSVAPVAPLYFTVCITLSEIPVTMTSPATSTAACSAVPYSLSSNTGPQSACPSTPETFQVNQRSIPVVPSYEPPMRIGLPDPSIAIVKG